MTRRTAKNDGIVRAVSMFSFINSSRVRTFPVPSTNRWMMCWQKGLILKGVMIGKTGERLKIGNRRVATAKISLHDLPNNLIRNIVETHVDSSNFNKPTNQIGILSYVLHYALNPCDADHTRISIGHDARASLEKPSSRIMSQGGFLVLFLLPKHIPT